MLHIDTGMLLAEVREDAGMTQKQVAERLGTHQSQVSRLEKGEAALEYSDYERYLEVVGTPKSQRLAAALRVDWQHLPQPSLRHPDLDVLIETEAALARLDVFRQGSGVPQVLAGQADLLYRRLTEFGEFLLRLDHKIVYVGEIGVGKTTAACRQAGLVLDAEVAQDLKGMLLDTGGGRTTLCEVVVRRGERFAIQVDPLPDEEVYRLAGELCRAIVERRDADATSDASSDFKPPEEVERALRNMAGLLRPSRRKGMPPVADPASELATQFTSHEDFNAEFASKLTLWRRTRRKIEFDGSDERAGRQWLRETFTAINNGRHAEFSLPGRIALSVPFSPIEGTTFDMSLIDTRGVDGSAIRPDIVAQIKDRRALTLLCSKWGSAPDTALQDLLRHGAETEVDPDLFSHVAILVLARSGDALSMRNDSGESAGDAEEGYEIKKAHVEDALQRINLLGTDVRIFDAANDDASTLTSYLVSKIGALRSAQANNARLTIDAIDHMLQNVEQAQALAALNEINNDLLIFAERHKRLKASRQPFHGRLIDAVESRHPRTVWAATRRAGSFWNFDMYQHLGDGAAADAKSRASQAIAGLREIIANRLADPTFESAHTFLAQVVDDIDRWEADLVRAARHHADTVFKPVLSADAALWAACEDKYGRGLSYKEEVKALLKSWFEEREELQDEIEKQLQRAWTLAVQTPLRTAAGVAGKNT